MGSFLYPGLIWDQRISILYPGLLYLGYTVIVILQKSLFRRNSKWRQKKQNASVSNSALSPRFWWLISTNHVKFTKEYVMYTEKHV